MKRTKLPNKRKVPLPLEMMKFLLEQESSADLISLYTFYCFVAAIQNTNNPKITIAVTSGNLGWPERRTKAVKLRLKDLNLIDEGVTANHVLLPFLPENFSTAGACGQNRLPNDSVIYNITSSISNGCTTSTLPSSNKKITPSMFDQFWSLYPRKTDKGKALSKWLAVCKRPDCPTWRQVKRAILQQKNSERWQDSQFIPLPTTWLNQRRWLDDPKEMKKINFDQPSSGPSFVIDDGRRYDRCSDGEYRNAAGEIYIP